MLTIAVVVVKSLKPEKPKKQSETTITKESK
jgi:hypothetical protein